MIELLVIVALILLCFAITPEELTGPLATIVGTLFFFAVVGAFVLAFALHSGA